MQIPINEIARGEHDGKIVWICDYVRPDFSNKPIRNLPPVKVLICVNDAADRIYYSNSHFKKLNGKGEPIKSGIKPFDNTGYRSYAGNPVSVFDNEEECRLKWKELVDKTVRELEQHKEGVAARCDREIQELLNTLK